MQKLLLIAGVVLLILGILWPWIGKLPWGRLPGDIYVDRPGFKFFFPLSTMILISLLVSLIMWFFRK